MNKEKNAPGSVQTTINIYKKYGIRKVFLGLNSTMLRELIGLTLYFGSYDFFLQSMMTGLGLDIMTASFQAGGVAGMLCWSVIYPIHYIKVKIQTDSLDNPRYQSATQCAKETLGKQFRTMYTGVGWFLLRAYLVNGATFIVFERTKKMLYSDKAN